MYLQTIVQGTHFGTPQDSSTITYRLRQGCTYVPVSGSPTGDSRRSSRVDHGQCLPRYILEVCGERRTYSHKPQQLQTFGFSVTFKIVLYCPQETSSLFPTPKITLYDGVPSDPSVITDPGSPPATRKNEDERTRFLYI